MYADGEFHADSDEQGWGSPAQLRAYPRIAVGSPSEERPITPGGDIVSDELSFAKWRRASGNDKGKKKNSKKSSLRQTVASGADSPASAFVETVNKNTGFSPLNPTAPLHDAFQSTLSPPPQPKPLLMVHTPSPSPPPPQRREFLLDPARTHESPAPSVKPTLLSPVAETPQVPARPSFDAVRPQLFQKAFLDSIRGVPFDDTDIYLCSTRSKDGIAHKPLAVHARSDFLHAASAIFAEEIFSRCAAEPSAIPRRRSSRIEYGYDCDSDLEDCEEEKVQQPQPTSKPQPPKPVRSRSSTTSFDNEATPKSAALSATDIDVVSLDDFSSTLSLSDDSEETIAKRRPSLNLETNVSVLNWRDEHMKDTAIPIKKAEVPEEIKLPPSPEETILVQSYSREAKNKILFIPGSAYRTWQALLLYLYNDALEFAPLRTQKDVARPQSAAGTVFTSPKSMYRLAAKLGLEQLKAKSFDALKEALSKDNIVDELFSDFTWRYPEVLQMETEVFHRYASESVVQSALAEKFQEIAYGQLPHSSVVLSSLFKKFISTSSGWK